MEIKKTLLPIDKRKPLPKDPTKLPFGRQFTDHMFTLDYKPDSGWKNPQIKPYRKLLLDPASNIFHYCQEVFEGQKAYKSTEGDILLFRPEQNARRLSRSLKRMCMPEIPEEVYLEALYALIKVDERWIPSVRGTSLYIRPTVIGTEAALGVRPSNEYLFYIILSPVGPYFPTGFQAIGLWVSDIYARATPGGTGEAKTGGNYAASLIGGTIAKEKGYDQALWLDSSEHRYAEEGGAMNIFFVVEGNLITPPLSGSILPGITRKSILELAPDMGIKAIERPIAIEEITEGITGGKISEIFCAGTAAIVTPVGRLCYKDRNYTLSTPEGPWARKFYDQLIGIQYGEIIDTRGWIKKLA